MRTRIVVLALSASLWLCGSLLWQITDTIPYCRAVALGDLDGDGDLDAFLANGRHEGVEPDTVWLNDGRGRFSDSGQGLGKNDSRSAELHDLDGDGDLDVLLCGAWSPPLCEIVENVGGGRLASRQWLVKVDDRAEPTALGQWSAAAGDLDGDGVLDVLGVNCCGPRQIPVGGATMAVRPHNLVWLNDGAGNLADSGQRLGVRDSYAVALGDLDGDGDLDAFVANGQGLASDWANAVWLNDGRGQLAARAALSGELDRDDSRAVALGDVDGDGDLDAFVGNLGVDLVWLNDGVGSFSDSGQRLGDAWTQVVRLADLDRDGDLDAFVGDQRSVQIWTNDGAGHFEPGRRIAEGFPGPAVALGDVDGDGDLDAVAGRSRRGPLVWLNDGTGRFVPRDRPWVWVALSAALLATVGLWWFSRRRLRLESAVDCG
jgi:hypothetical protein